MIAQTTDQVRPNSRTKRRKPSLATQVLFGLVLGIAVGIFFGEMAGFLKIGGDAFIALLQITVIPYVMVALITSVGRLTLSQAKALGVKAGSILLVLWGLGVVFVLLAPLAFPNWPAATFFSASAIEDVKRVDFLQLYIPANLFAALANATVPAIVVFSLLFGLALISVPGKERILDLLSTAGDALMGINAFVGRLAPYGVFAITANAAGTIDVADLGRLQVFIVVYVVLALILSLWVVPGLIAALTPLRIGAVLRTFRGPLVTAFATGNVLIVLPVLAADSKRLIGEASSTGKPTEQEESSVDILIPASYPFPTLGVILALMFVLFGGWYVGTGVAFTQYPTLVVAGLATLFGGTILSLPFLFDLLRLPADLFQVFLTVDVIGSRFGTLLAGMHIIAVALIGTYALCGSVRIRPAPLLRLVLITVALTGGGLFGVRAFYTWGYVAPYTKAQILSGLHLSEAPPPRRVFREPLPEEAEQSHVPLGPDRIKQRGVLRVCYTPDEYPLSFFNAAGELVGFDVEMAHRFARALDTALEFRPVGSIEEARVRLDSGYCDVLMSLIGIAPDRIDDFAMTAPILHTPVGMIMKDHLRTRFRTWDAIREMKDLRVATANNPSARAFLRRLLPQATPVPYEDMRQLERMLAAGAPDIDAIAMFAEEAAAWTIRYPQFSFVPPTPVVRIPTGYAVARANTDLLRYLDTWLLTANLNGTVDQFYRYWMLVQVKHTQSPRWSVIRDVLGWIE
jgi:Na+/H+-dicarboxylate symporter/ABC-type amino acid transport substrate-binding protein